MKRKWKGKLLSHIWLFVTPWTVAHQAPLSMEFSRQEYWSVLPCPSPGDLPNPGIEPRSPELRADSLPAEPPGKPNLTLISRLAQNFTGRSVVYWTYSNPIRTSPEFLESEEPDENFMGILWFSWPWMKTKLTYKEDYQVHSWIFHGNMQCQEQPL